MAGGPFLPFSSIPDASGLTFGMPYVGGGGGTNNPSQIDASMVAASIGSDCYWDHWFALPPSALPSGTLKLYLRGMASATSGAAKITPYSMSIAPGGYPSLDAAFAEAQQTITWVADGSTTWDVASIVLGASGGTGYATGDQITAAGGTFSQAAIFRVSAQTGGAVTALQIMQQGVYSVKPAAGALTQGSTTGSGTGCLITATFDTAGSADKLQEVKVTLTPPAIVNGLYGIRLIYNTSGWTLAAKSGWEPSLIFE